MEFHSSANYKFHFNSKLPKINTINPIVENKRYVVYRKLETDFVNYFAQFGTKLSEEKKRVKITKAFGRWIMLQISLGNTNDDPVIPSSFSSQTFDQLKEDIVNFTKDKTLNLDNLIAKFNMESRCKQAIDDIAKVEQLDHVKHLDKNIVISIYKNKQQRGGKNDCNAVSDSDQEFVDSNELDSGYSGSNLKMIKLEYKPDMRVVELTEELYNRVRILFTMNQSFSVNLRDRESSQLFHYLLYCLMLRYITISEEGVRQAGLTQTFFDALFRMFGIDFECFASGFGSSTRHICSLFYDIERYFGSYGNFFDMIPEKGFYQCSPPLDSLITTQAMEYVLQILEKDKNIHPLGFICMIPCWDFETIKQENKESRMELYEDFPIYYTLRDSKFLIYNLNVVNKKIAYYQYQGKSALLGIFHSPHIIVVGNNKFKNEFDAKKMDRMLDIFIKNSL